MNHYRPLTIPWLKHRLVTSACLLPLVGLATFGIIRGVPKVPVLIVTWLLGIFWITWREGTLITPSSQRSNSGKPPGQGLR